jgi:tripartite-type tricarboxylate transporter receptor subunit TctC
MKVATILLRLLSMLALLVPGVLAADPVGRYPSSAITLIVPYAAGGGGDVFTRAVASEAQAILGTRILVENRTGGGATIGVGMVARARPDGYTLGFVSSSAVVVVPSMVRVPYDPVSGLTYLARFAVSPYPLAVRADDARFKTFADLIAYARTNPGRLKWSTAGMNGAPYVATLAAFRQEKVRAAYVPMQGSTEVLAGLLGRVIDLGVLSDYGGPLAAGDIRVLAEIGRDPVPELPGIPTFGQLGYPLTPSIFYGLIGPAGLPPEVVERWEATMQKITASPSFRQLAKRLNARVEFQGHAEFQAAVHADIATTRRELQAEGIVRR